LRSSIKFRLRVRLRARYWCWSGGRSVLWCSFIRSYFYRRDDETGRYCLALLGVYRSESPSDRRGDLRIDFVRGDFKQRRVDFNKIADFVKPLCDRGLYY
jgi:hypothetical protein